MTEYALDVQARYAKTHEWVRLEDGIAVVGISDAAQDQLSDVVFVELPELNQSVTAGTPIAVVESVKAAEDIYAPITGTIVAVNGSLEDSPDLVNADPYAAWFFKIAPSGDTQAELANLMDPQAYDAYVEESAH